MKLLPGSVALSPFRQHRLLERLRELEPAIEQVSARYLHIVDVSNDLTPEENTRLERLLTYGVPFQAPTQAQSLTVIPRLGTLSPWASKATDIATEGAAHRTGHHLFFYWQVGFAGWQEKP